MERILILLIFLLAGTISIMASALNWDWFLLSSNARPIVSRLGRRGARLFYGLVGVVLLAMAVWFLFQKN